MELVIFMGLQASGKTSFYRDRFAQKHVHVSKDNFRNNRNRERRQKQLIQDALREGRSVVVDNTNSKPGDRIPLIALAVEHGAKVTGYYFESRVEDCLARNRQREGRNRVPDEAIFTTIKRLERPTQQEGYDRLFYVRALPEGGFEVQDWHEDEVKNEQR